MKKFLLSLLTFIILLPAFPQQLKKMEIVGKPRKMTDGELITRKDGNGRYCAAIKFVSDMDGFSYDSWDGIIGDVKNHPGQDIVFVTPTERVLEIFKTGYEPLKIILSDLGITLQPQDLWQIKIAGNEQADVLPVTFRFIPEDAKLFIDGKAAGTTLSPKLAIGTHQIKIERDGYQTINETITVSDNKVFFEWQMEEAPDAGLQITTQPAGATIYLDGVKLGESPIAAFYPPGNYPLTIRKEGFVPIENETLKVALPKTTKNYILEENVGYLTIYTRDEATVYFNGEEMDNHSRVKLSPQLVQVKVSMPKADDLEEQVVVKKDDDISLDMFPNIQTGTIQVAVTPFDADIELIGDGGEYYTSKGMKIFRNIPVGMYTLNVNAEGYISIEESVLLKSSEKINKTIDLETAPQTGTIKVKVNPTDAKIELVNAYGKYLISQGTDEFEFVPQGIYTLRVTAPGYVSAQETFTLKPSERVDKKINLEKVKNSSENDFKSLIDVFTCSPIYSQKNSNSSNQIASACSGKVEFIQRVGDYCKVKYENIVGYIPVGFIKETPAVYSQTEKKSAVNTNNKKESSNRKTYSKDKYSGVQEVFTCSAIYNSPNLNDNNQIDKACDGYVTVIKKFNENFYLVQKNKIEGYLWVGSFKN